MSDLTTLKTQLADAKAAYHQLVLGNKMVEIRVGGRWMQKTPADKAGLKEYIRELTGQVSRLEGGGLPPRSPISLYS